MKIFTLICCILMLFTSYSQSDFERISVSGKAPKFINANEYFPERSAHKVRPDYMDKHKKPEVFLRQVVNSGKLIYGHKLNVFVQRITDQLTKGNHPITAYILKSDLVATITIDSKNIAVTTGLISRLKHQDQLAYFLAREIDFALIGEYPKLERTDFKRIISFDEKIAFLAYRNWKQTLELDVSGAKRFKDAGFEPSLIEGCFDLLLHSDFPFEQTAFNLDYFNDSLFFIPKTFYDDFEKIKSIEIPKSNYFKQKKKAITARVDNLHIRSSTNNTSTFDSSDTDFIDVRNICRFETVRQQIINGNCFDAIYSIYVLENLLGKSEYLDHLKAHAWLGQVAIEAEVATRKKQINFRDFDIESASFYLTIKKLNINGIGALALRTVNDISTKYNSEEAEIILNKLIKYLHESPYFDRHKFSNKTYLEAKKTHVLVTDSTNNDSLDFNASEFYFYGISDLVNASILSSEFHQASYSYRDSIHSITVYPFIHKNSSNRSVKNTASIKNLNAFKHDLSKLKTAEFNLLISDDENYTDDLTSLLKETYMQSYRMNGYSSSFIPLYLNDLKRLTKDDVASFAFFESGYKLRLKAIHLLGLLVAPLPAIIPEAIISSFRGKYGNLIVDGNTGEILFSGYVNYFEPQTSKMMVNRIHHDFEILLSTLVK